MKIFVFTIGPRKLAKRWFPSISHLQIEYLPLRLNSRGKNKVEVKKRFENVEVPLRLVRFNRYDIARTLTLNEPKCLCL